MTIFRSGAITQIATSNGFTDTACFRLAPPLKFEQGDDMKDVVYDFRNLAVIRHGGKVADLIEVDHRGRDLPPIESLRADVNNWQTIDSAPKDGTIVLGWIPSRANTRGGFVEFVKWAEALDTWIETDAEVAGECEPTHWIPYPEPPT